MAQPAGSLFLVEDDRDLRELLKDLLESEGYDVTTASDGLDALSKLKSISAIPRLIVLDWMMPRMDGAQFCIEKNGIAHLSPIPVIVLTADGRLNEKVAQAGAVMGIAKPVDIDLLLSAVHKYMM
jgi:DNA-binding response OmpR family regulator